MKYYWSVTLNKFSKSVPTTCLYFIYFTKHVRDNNGRHHLLGLVSSGTEPCGIDRGGVYTNVGHYLSWIRMTKLQDVIDDYKVQQE